MKNLMGHLKISTVHLMSKAQRFLKLLEPLAIVLAALGLILTWHEFRASRDIREATLFAMASELLQKARDVDRLNNHGHPTAQLGQVRVLEEAISSQVSLQGINAREVRLEHGRFAGADFRHANLWGSGLQATDLSNVNLEGALLSRAFLGCTNNRDNMLICTNLTNANLKNAQLTNAKLSSVTLDGADFEGVNMGDAKLYSVDFTNVKGLTKGQLKNVCGSKVTMPSGYNDQVKECK